MKKQNDAETLLAGRTPIELFATWLEEAKQTLLRDANAMVVSTVDEKGWPSSRVVLLKELRPTGLVFYTNYESRKGREISARPHFSANFFWDPLARQVKWQGKIEKVSREDSEKYWASRPRGSQLSQWVSKQSTPVESREHLEQLYTEAERQFHGQNIPCPAHWGGYLLRPTYVEFWIGRESRFHDRFAYQKVENSENLWKGQRLYP